MMRINVQYILEVIYNQSHHYNTKKKDQPDQNPSITSLKQGKATNET